jgi:hypothetical protein
LAPTIVSSPIAYAAPAPLVKAVSAPAVVAGPALAKTVLL